MPIYLTSFEWARDLWPLPVLALFTSLLIFPFKKYWIEEDLSGKKISTWGATYFVVFSIALLGVAIGQMTGQSREPVVGAVIPAVLGLFGTLSVYITATKELRVKLLVACSMTVFTANLMIGTFWGAKLRQYFDDYRNSQTYRLYVEQINHNVNLEKLKNEFQLERVKKLMNSQL